MTLLIAAALAALAASQGATPASRPAPAAPPAKAAAPKYKAGAELSFEELLIQGQLRRPELSVVTGNSGEDPDGLLRLREDFLDQVAIDLGEEVK